MTLARIVRVVLWMSGALLSFSTMAVSIRELSRSLGMFEILSIRSAAGFAIVLVVGALNPALRRTVTLRRIGLHIARSTSHFAAQYVWALSITLLPLATVFALEFTAPAYTALLAALFLGERMTASRIGVIVFGFLGVLVILRPGLESFQPAALLMLVVAFGFAVTMVLLKKLTSSESAYAVVFWMNLMQLPLALSGTTPAAFLHTGDHGWLPVFGLGVSGLSAHYCLTNAFRAGDASLVVPLDFMRIPLIALVGWWMYGEALDAYVFAGAALIVVGILWNLRAEATGARAEVSAAAVPDA